MMEDPKIKLTPVVKLSRDIKAASAVLTRRQAGYLVTQYYVWQDQRKRAGSQGTAMDKFKEPEPHEVITWLGDQANQLELQIKGALSQFARNDATGRWAMSITGIGPIISAGLLAHIDMEKAPTVGHIWRFAGLDPTVKWEKGQKRPWNTALKTLCWHIGESFVRQRGRDSGKFYGNLFDERKAQEIVRNDDFQFKAQAEHILATKKIGKTTDAYGYYIKGMLPPAHIHARAKRYTVKLFLSHWHEIAFRYKNKGQMPPKPYILTQEGGHAHMITPPNYPQDFVDRGSDSFTPVEDE